MFVPASSIMTAERPLRGGCLCARNQYIIQRPKDATEIAQVLFDTDSLHRTFPVANSYSETGKRRAIQLAGHPVRVRPPPPGDRC